MNTSPLGSAWTLPWLPASSGVGCTNCATSVCGAGAAGRRPGRPRATAGGPSARRRCRRCVIVAVGQRGRRRAGRRWRRPGPSLTFELLAADRRDAPARCACSARTAPRCCAPRSASCLRALVDRVEVEVVERPFRGAAACGEVGGAERDVVEAVPLAPHEPGLQVDFLEEAVGDRARARAARRARGRSASGLNTVSSAVSCAREVEVVQVGEVAVAGAHACRSGGRRCRR